MQSESPNDNLLSVKPAGWYWRKAIREAETIHEVRQIGYQLAEEVEYLKDVCRDHGIIPPRRYQPHQIVPDDPRQGVLADIELSVSASPDNQDSPQL